MDAVPLRTKWSPVGGDDDPEEPSSDAVATEHCRSIPKAAVLVLAVAAVLALLGLVSVRYHGGAFSAAPSEAVELQLQPPPSVQNWGENCWVACGGSGNCPGFCGAGSACCRFGSTKDPPECGGIQLWGSKAFHTCVAPVAAVSVLHAGQDCWEPCQGSGRCTWCGHGNACCRWGRAADPPECKSVNSWPAYTHHTCVAVPAGQESSLGPPPVASACLPGEIYSESTATCTKAAEPALMKFYMYRSQNGDAYHTENVNMASLTGALWYLHNEVVISCPRKFALTKLVRYLVTMKNPSTLWTPPNHYQFGQFVQFDSGACTWNNSHCETLWNKYGYVVGCQPLDVQSPGVPNYAGPPAPVWYSLPGKCPSKAFTEKTDECMTAEPGGECATPDGSTSCTWRVDPAGEVTLDELTGSSSDEAWCQQGNLEYNRVTDQGVGTSFWNNRRDAEASRERVARVQLLFQQKYPSFPATLGDPPCDWWR